MRRVLLATVFSLTMLSGTSFAQQCNPNDPAVLCTLKTLRAEYPTPMSKGQLGAMLDRTVASHAGWRLYRKPQGNNCPQPMTGVPISCDIIVQTHGLVGTMFDVLIDQDNAATPGWREVGETDDTEKWIRPVSGSTSPEPTPPPTPQPSDDVLNELRRLQETQTQIDAKVQQLLAEIAAHEYLQQAERDRQEAERIEQAKFREGVRSEYRRFAVFTSKYVLPAIVAFFGGRAIAN
jgi:hypothetical protein